MNPINATEARSTLYHLIDQTNDSHEPVLITGKRNNAVLVSEADWLAIQETLYLNSVPGLSKDIRKGLATPLDKCSRELKW